ncbi:hypothetical protein QBC47DRAFT_386034 [Echria macrotheca]|uniref:Uncharacterized protein n=1 Tax=Echria macrotheca TaxID=438768 RepID=A0AAJ0BA30_9PEZI|nr:hypothetical protein QBC47DRAFT_386034 [Echria macrotheca]
MSGSYLAQGVKMAVSALEGLISGLYKSVQTQRKVVQKQEDSVRFLDEANFLIDVDGATGATIEQEREQLRQLQSSQTELENEFQQAVDKWRDLGRVDQPWVSSHSAVPSARRSARRKRVVPARSQPRLEDPSVGSFARYMSAERAWEAGPHVDPSALSLDRTYVSPAQAKLVVSDDPTTTPWVFTDPDELDNPWRPYGRQGFVAPMERSFGRQPMTDEQRKLPFRYNEYPPGTVCPDLEVDFWERQLGSRQDIFAERFTIHQGPGYPGYTRGPYFEESISPRSVVPQRR